MGNGSWKFNFLRAFNDWETDQIANLFYTLQKVKVNTESDRISWKGEGGKGIDSQPRKLIVCYPLGQSQLSLPRVSGFRVLCQSPFSLPGKQSGGRS